MPLVSHNNYGEALISPPLTAREKALIKRDRLQREMFRLNADLTRVNNELSLIEHEVLLGQEPAD